MRRKLKRVLSAFLMFACVFTIIPNSLALGETKQSLAAGAYTVTANLYVAAEDNEVLKDTAAYLTNRSVPPLESVQNNAKLYVDGDGRYQVTVTNLNSFFALQQISSNDANMKARIAETQTVSDNPKYYNSRINTVTFNVDPTISTYRFDNCKEYAVPFAGIAPNKTMPLTLSIDFDSAKWGFNDQNLNMVSRNFSDDYTECDISVSSSEESVISQMADATFEVQKVSDSEKNNLTSKISSEFYGEVQAEAYNFILKNKSGKTIELSGNTEVAVTFPSVYSNPKIYQIAGDSYTEITNPGYIDGKSVFTVRTLGTFVFADWQNRIHTINHTSDDGKVSFTYRCPMNEFAIDAWFKGVTSHSRVYKNGNDTEYYVAIQNHSLGESNAAVYKEGAEWNITLPYAEGDNVYIVTKSKCSYGSGKTKKYKDDTFVNQVNGTIENGTITFNLFDKSLGFSDDDYSEFADATYNAYTNTETPENHPVWVYFLVTKSKYADNPLPVKLSDMTPAGYYKTTYNGTAQNAYAQGKNNIFGENSKNVTSNNTKTNPKYTLTVKPAEGYHWFGTENDISEKELDYYIVKARIKATYDGQIIKEGEKPDPNRITITGFAEGEDATTVDGFDQLNLRLDFKEADLKVGEHYNITPQYDKVKAKNLDNYSVTANGGTLIVLPSDAVMIEAPEAITGLRENGEEQVGVPAGEGYTVTGNTATSAGRYTATVTLKDNYYWTNGKHVQLEIPWSIGRKINTSTPVPNPKPDIPTNPTDKTQTVTANLYLDGKYNTVLPGITVYLNNPNNPIKGTGTPTVPQSDNATLTTTANGDLLLTLELPNPVFTLQKIGGGSNASIESTKTSSDLAYASGVKRKRDSRISKVIFKLNDKSGEYKFDDCEEFPTAINPDSNWKSPLVLKVQFKGGTDSSLDSNKNVDTSKVNGGTTVPTVKTDITVKVKDDTATVSKINTDDLSSKNSITLDVTDGNKGVTGVNLPVSALEKIVDAKVPGTTLALSDTSAKFDLAALTEVTKAASGKTALLRILTGSDAEKKLSATEKSAMSDVKNASAVSVALSSDDKAITSLGSGKLTVSVPFKWDGKGAVRAYQVDANGKLVSVPVTCKNNVAELILTGTGNFILGTVDTKSFDDVADDAFYKTAVDWAVENGVTSGISDTLFAPAKTCTRAQVVTFLWRAAGSPEPTKTENPFADVKSDAYYYKAVLWALEKGITSGTSATTFAPEAVVSRAQVVTFQWRMADSAKANGTNNFTDVPADSYYKDAVQWAVDNNITAGTSATTFAPNAGCTRGQIVTFLYRQLGK